MGPISTLLRRAGWRLGVARFIEALIVLCTGLLAAAIVVRIAQQAFTFNVPWLAILTYGPAVIVALSLVYSLVRRDSSLAVARRVDEGADLRESLSTALAVQGSSDAWARTMVEQATERARTVDVRKAVPITVPRWWPSPIVAALALLVVWLTVPGLDVLGRKAQARERDADQQKIEQAKVESQQAVAKVQEALRKIDPAAGEKQEIEIPKAANLTPEDIRRAAVKNLTDMKARLESLKNSEKSQSAKATLDKMKDLRTPGQGPLSEMTKELAKGDFKQAGAALKDLASKLQNKELSAKEMDALKKQLEEMAKQLDKLAGDKQALEQRLAEMGLDKTLANNPEAMKEAMKAGAQASKHLTQEQKDQLQKMAEAMKAASQACQNMSQAMQKAAGECNSGGMGQEGMQAMASMAQQMGSMEAMAQDLASIQAGMSEAQHQLSQMSSSMGQCNSPGMGACQNGMFGTGRFGEGDTNLSQGFGSGGPGQSKGGPGVGESHADEKWQTRKFTTTNTGQGPIIGSSVVEGESIKGEAKAAFQAAVAAAEATTAEALENNVVERQYHDVVKHYFGRLKAKAGPQTPVPQPPAGEPARDGGK